MCFEGRRDSTVTKLGEESSFVFQQVYLVYTRSGLQWLLHPQLNVAKSLSIYGM
jgi:hypothetical protein